MRKSKSKLIQERVENWTDYYVTNDKGVIIFESSDLFKCLDVIKKVEKPDYKLIRRRDKKVLSYTSAPKFDLGPDPKYH